MKITKVTKTYKYECERCRIPRSCYDLKHEPSMGNPDFTQIGPCQEGHSWVLVVDETQYQRGGYE